MRGPSVEIEGKLADMAQNRLNLHDLVVKRGAGAKSAHT